MTAIQRMIGSLGVNYDDDKADLGLGLTQKIYTTMLDTEKNKQNKRRERLCGTDISL